ncbi:MAG: hypothetical protein CMM52_15925 [Rhodospirillaceae bacterium]|nr:hypothetical protein [Rhodospirillaceae bacterium]|tara:strand:- start:1814 stop:2083 length:270 start_codon:yes stop_codon:yes gene_type:complete
MDAAICSAVKGRFLVHQKGSHSMSKARARERAKARAGKPAKKRQSNPSGMNQNSWPGQVKSAGKGGKSINAHGVDGSFSRTQRGSARSG